jgi:hypothetical protein
MEDRNTIVETKKYPVTTSPLPGAAKKATVPSFSGFGELSSWSEVSQQYQGIIMHAGRTSQ